MGSIKLVIGFYWLAAEQERSLDIASKGIFFGTRRQAAQKNTWIVVFVLFSTFLGQFGCRLARKIDRDLLGYGVTFAQKMSPNGLRENWKLPINMSVKKTISNQLGPYWRPMRNLAETIGDLFKNLMETNWWPIQNPVETSRSPLANYQSH